MGDTGRTPTRREEYAEATRQAIVNAARRLFDRQGFFATKVEDIAATARVSPATVYSVSGGKQGLLRTLMDMGTAAPKVSATIESILALDDAGAMIDRLARGMRKAREEFGDIVRLIVQTAPHEESAAATCADATERYRQALAKVGGRLAEMGALRHGMSAEAATDILWFYFGYAGFATLVEENRWGYDRAESWLAEQARHALLAR